MARLAQDLVTCGVAHRRHRSLSFPGGHDRVGMPSLKPAPSTRASLTPPRNRFTCPRWRLSPPRRCRGARSPPPPTQARGELCTKVNDIMNTLSIMVPIEVRGDPVLPCGSTRFEKEASFSANAWVLGTRPRRQTTSVQRIDPRTLHAPTLIPSPAHPADARAQCAGAGRRRLARAVHISRTDSAEPAVCLSENAQPEPR